jgi:hypothetical protein
MVNVVDTNKDGDNELAIVTPGLDKVAIAHTLPTEVTVAKGESFLVSYQRSVADPNACGGGYLKLAETVPPAELDEKTPYLVMFGACAPPSPSLGPTAARRARARESHPLPTPPTPPSSRRPG